ncbi:hypothetical protein N431DRAFT_445161 [Stipitochalara longipes BDJ]|nr:hypothetical protein N431DRAFT_445161 [Stipitochalara longipes BDJ]
MAFVAYLVIVWQFVVSRRCAVTAKDKKTAKLFSSLDCDGCRKWSVDSGVIAYGVFDILAMPAFGFWLIFAPSSLKFLSIEGWWSHVICIDEGVICIDDNSV